MKKLLKDASLASLGLVFNLIPYFRNFKRITNQKLLHDQVWWAEEDEEEEDEEDLEKEEEG